MTGVGKREWKTDSRVCRAKRSTRSSREKKTLLGKKSNGGAAVLDLSDQSRHQASSFLRKKDRLDIPRETHLQQGEDEKKKKDEKA